MASTPHRPPRPGPRVAGDGGVELATWDLGGDGPPVLLAHATGLHAWTWLGVGQVLARSHRVWALDQRGHGTSGHPTSGEYRDWSRFALDLLAVVDALELDRPAGVGHSLGGAALILAEQHRPGTFSALWCYEPIVFAPGSPPRDADGHLAAISRRRRQHFESRQAAIDNFRTKPPFAGLAPGVLEDYVEHAFADDTDGGVRLRLTGDEEATVYEGAPRHDAYQHLGWMDLPVTVAGSGRDDGGPGSAVEALAAQIPGARAERFDGLSHFGPLEDPGRIAGSIAAALGSGYRSTGRVPPPR